MSSINASTPMPRKQVHEYMLAMVELGMTINDLHEAGVLTTEEVHQLIDDSSWLWQSYTEWLYAEDNRLYKRNSLIARLKLEIQKDVDNPDR